MDRLVAVAFIPLDDDPDPGIALLVKLVGGRAQMSRALATARFAGPA
jgi:hypothetical protein